MNQRLDETQQKAVTHGAGPLLVTAGPGSGKTTVITHHIKYLIDNLGVSPKEILVITFTKSAAKEMKERFLGLSCTKDTEVFFGTFHAFFYQILRRSGGLSHNSIIQEKEKYILLRDILKQYHIKFYENTFLDELLSEISRIKNKGTTNKYDVQILDKEVFDMVYTEYQRRMRAIQKIDFDDIILQCYELLSNDMTALTRWQNCFRYILVDEFQDINMIQYEILKLLAEKHHNIFAVGDEDQSIYSFRGANPRISFQFLKDYPDATQLFLSVNYRSDYCITEASKLLISHNKERFIKEIQSARKEKGILEILSYTCEQEEYEALAKQLLEYQKNGTLHQCVILFRTNMISPVFLRELKKYKIPYCLKNGLKRWNQHPVIKDIMAYMAMAEGNMEKRNLARVMNKPIRYISNDMLGTQVVTWKLLMQNAKGKFDVQEQIQKLQRDIVFMGKLPLVAALGYIRRGIGYEKWLKEQDEKTYYEGIEILDMLRVLLYDCETVEDLEELLEGEPEKLQHHNDTIDILTYHGAKGLEWPVVFLPDVMEGNTPYKRAHSKAEMEEERRMFYVALTRAKNAVYIYNLFKDEKHKKSPSSFIGELKGDV